METLEPLHQKFFSRLGHRVMILSQAVGAVSVLAHKTFVALFKHGIKFRDIIQQIYFVGYRTLPLTTLVGIFTGMVLALQFIVGLKRFGLELYTGQVVGIAIVRELGPVLTALMVAARAGSGIAAELGSMEVTEQIPAIQAMGGDPVHKLVLPRVIGTTLMTPFLTMMADIVGIFGGMLVTVIEAGIGAQFYLDQVLQTVHLEDFFSGIFKTLFFGLLIGLIACFHGLKTTHGTQGVGESTTKAVVYSSMAVFVADYFLTKAFLLF